MSNIGLRVQFSKVINFLSVAHLIWRKKSDFFVTVDYHYFTKEKPILKDLEIERSILNRQLKFFSREFEILNPKKFSFQSFFLRKRKKLAMLITIDDGDKSICDNMDIFEKYDIPIIIFLPIGLCVDVDSIDGLRSKIFRYFFEIDEDTRESLYGDMDIFFQKVIHMNHKQLKVFLLEINKYRNCIDPISDKDLLSLEELLSLSDHPLVTLSSHTMSPPVLSKIPLEWVKWEIETAKKYIQKIGGDTRFFAYPYGFKESYSERVQQCLFNAGIQFSFTTRSMKIKSNSNPFELGRVGMHNVYDKRYLKGLVGGAFELWDRLLLR